MAFINLTPHAITLDDGVHTITIAPSGNLARVTVEETVTEQNRLGFAVITRKAGEVEFGTILCDYDTYLVSSMVLDAIPTNHVNAGQVFAPDTGKTASRNDAGHVISVARLVAVS